VNTDWEVVVLDKDAKKRAEGKVVSLKATGEKIPQGMLRYDVHMADLRQVQYKPERLQHTGIAVLYP